MMNHDGKIMSGVYTRTERSAREMGLTGATAAVINVKITKLRRECLIATIFEQGRAEIAHTSRAASG